MTVTRKIKGSANGAHGRVSVMVTEGPDAGRSAVVGKGGLIIGSSGECGLVLSDPTVSRRHASVNRTAEGLLLEDLGSTNGVVMDGNRVQRAYLADGAVVVMGKTTLTVSVGETTSLIEEGGFGEMVSGGPAMAEVFNRLRSLAAGEVTVLIEGETGTGKELAARAIHQHGARKNGPFVVFDCSTVPGELMESELFGHIKGAFTGAGESRPGAVGEAREGTLFLDEIGELPLNLQPKLLRLLDRREFKKVGEGRSSVADIRFVAATNRDLEDQVSEGSFRQDLFFRLSAARVKLPPLRERMEDLPALIEHFLAGAARKAGRRITLAPAAEQALASYSWPGNVRELKNALETASVLTSTGTIGVAELPDLTFDAGESPGSMRDAEARAVKDALERAGGNKRKAARLLSIAPSTLYAKMKKFGLD